MHCPACGSEAKDSARFCTQCGASLESVSKDVEVKADSSPKEEASLRIPLVENAKASFKEALDSSKRKSRRRMPVLLLVVLGMFLSATLAWAAYNVIFGAQQAGEEELARIEGPERVSIDLGEFVGPVRLEERPPAPSASPERGREEAEPVEEESAERPEEELVDITFVTESEETEDVSEPEPEPERRYSGWILVRSPSSSSSSSVSPHEEFFYDLTQEEIDEKVRRYEEQGGEVTYGFFGAAVA